MMSVYHEPALVKEVLHYLISDPEGIYVDGTVGGGGHAEAILTNISPHGKVVGIDRDCDAIEFAGNRLKKFGNRVSLLHDDYSKITRALNTIGINSVNGLLLDLGASSHQLENGKRGFSFQIDDKLDMRMDSRQVLDAWTVINKYDEKQLHHVLKNYGEERHSERIVFKIMNERKQKSINTTKQLAEIIESAVSKRYLIKSIARVFQAIRIEVNRELENLNEFLKQAPDLLVQGGRIVIISYHSLEDRIVKDYFKEESRKYIQSGNKFLPQISLKPRLRILTKKPIVPSITEINQNPKSRSAKLRSTERL